MTIIVLTTFGCCRGIFPSRYILSLLLCFEFENLLKFFIRQKKCLIILYYMGKACLLSVEHMMN